MRESTHLRGILIAGTLAALAVALGFVTLVMNRSASSAAPHVVLSLKARHLAGAVSSVHGASRSGAAAHPARKRLVERPDKNFVAALEAGLPRLVARGLAKRPVVVVELLTAHDPVSELATAEARAGAALAGAEFVGVNVDAEGGAASVLTGVLGKLPEAPAALIYTRPGNLGLTLAGFADRTTVQQAAADAAPASDAPVSADSGAWAAKVNAICTTTDAEVNALGGGSKLKPAQGFSIYGGMYKKIAAVTPPAGSAAAVRSANALLRKALGLLKEGHATEAAGHAATPLYSHALGLMGQWIARYNSLGASACTGAS